METSTIVQDQPKNFAYTSVEAEVEDQTRYKRFGLHPITLGDILPKPLTCVSDVKKEPRYRILLKLGYGASATVWLARDLVEERYVTVKVGLGSDKPLPDREAEILSQICKTGPGKQGYERVIELLDVFIVEGPNGFHQCLVTEVVAPLSDEDTNHYCSFDVVRQIVEGFAFLHGEGIVHGDPHIGNFGIALPQLDQFEEADIMEYFSNPEIILVVPRDPKLPMNSIPPYIVKSVIMTADFLKRRKAFPAGSLIVKIMGFGRAYRISKAAPNLLGAAPKMIRPPEYLQDYLSQAIQFGGPPSETWPKVWKTQDRQYGNCCHDTDTLAPALCDRVKVWEVREANLNSSRIPQDEERWAFLNFIKRMITTNPEERTPTRVLLTDPFMVERRKEEESI
ncbi:hypothetical protein E4U25_003297 [Claviceps purpurea]|nr:hypothetical protein E4U25_003297 [Claviceps purpurea]KAG6245958.1 hypothetical protein E4U23_004958 [Claviceps purpurea]